MVKNQLPRPTPKGGKKKKSSKKKAAAVNAAAPALGTNRQGPQMLKQPQLATYAPLVAFNVATGSTYGGVRIRGKELIQALNSGSSAAGGFGGNNTTSAGTLNLWPQSFPRLNAYTPIYEFYKFHYIKAIFQSSRPTTSSGVCELAIDYDAKDTAPTSTVGMMRNISSSMSNIYADNNCQMLGSLSRLPKYITNSTTALDTDQELQGIFLYAFEGLASTEVNTPQGYLVVEYDVEFFTPQ